MNDNILNNIKATINELKYGTVSGYEPNKIDIIELLSDILNEEQSILIKKDNSFTILEIEYELDKIRDVLDKIDCAEKDELEYVQHEINKIYTSIDTISCLVSEIEE